MSGVSTPPVDGAASVPASRLAQMHPAYFALVMATGIVSLAAHMVLDLRVVSVPMFGVNVVFYVALWALTIARAARHRDRFVADVLHHGRSVGFFTTVAATCVLGSQALIIGSAPRVALWLWGLGILLWAIVTYTIITILTVKHEKPTLPAGLNGGWLVSVVAAQSVANLGGQLAPGLGEHAAPVLFFCVATWLGAGMLYVWIISLIFYRYTFFVLEPDDLAPPYWINMGAAAISTLAGTTLIAAAPSSPLLRELLPFLRGATLFWWSTATWWVPMLVILGVWRHVYRRFPLRYDPLYWGAVFPLGLYTAATLRVSQTVEAPFLIAIPRGFGFVARAAWTVTLIGMLRSLTGSRAR